MQPKRPRARPCGPGSNAGFTLIEVLLALLLVAIGVLAAAPMFVYAMKVSAASADVGSDAAGAVKKLESLRQSAFATLTAGGSLNANVAGYCDTSNPAVTLRWTISDDTTPARRKTITIVAIATRRTSMGVQKSVRLTTLRAA